MVDLVTKKIFLHALYELYNFRGKCILEKNEFTTVRGLVEVSHFITS